MAPRGRWQRLWTTIIVWQYWCLSHGTVVVLLAVGLWFTLTVLANYDSDTTPISNAAFAMAASLSALCFGFARAIDSNDPDRDRIVYSGERFFQVALLLISASLLKYALISMHKFAVWPSVYKASTILLGMPASVLFFFALTSAHTGLKVINSILWKRLTRQPDWDDPI